MNDKKKKSGFSPLSKSARKFREDFARNVKDPSLIFKESCDQTILEVLKIHENHPNIVTWLMQRVGKWITFKLDDPIYGEDDIKQEVYMDLIRKTIPRKVEKGEWIYWHKLNMYLRMAIKGFCNNYLKRYYKDKGIFERVSDIDIFYHKESESYIEIQLLSSFTDRQIKIILLRGEEYNCKQIADEISCCTKTIYRELKTIRENKEFYNSLKEIDES